MRIQLIAFSLACTFVLSCVGQSFAQGVILYRPTLAPVASPVAVPVVTGSPVVAASSYSAARPFVAAPTTYSAYMAAPAPVTNYAVANTYAAGYSSYSVPYAAYSAPYTSYSPAVTPAAVAPTVVAPVAPVYGAVPVYSGVVSSKVYYPGEPVRNFFKAITP